MQNAGSREIHIQTIIHIAHERAEHPATRQLNRCIECHGTQRHQHIGHCQRDHKIIRNHSQLSISLHRNDDQRIPENRTDNYRTEDQALDAED